MRYIDRLPKPAILLKKEKEWLSKFLNSDKKRPDSNKYAHKDIRQQLASMSYHKCFYCERKLKNEPREVDHYIEVSEDRSLAFDWNNLYLACNNCNNKISNTTIPVADALNPCMHSDHDIESHITFEDEFITTKNNSTIGLKTIQKFRLDSELLDKKRIDQIKQFQKVLIKIQSNMIQEKRMKMTVVERECLVRFKQEDQPFSLMFRILLKQYNLQ